MVTALGAVLALVALIALIRGQGLGLPLALASGLVTGAFVVVGDSLKGNGIPAFYALAAGAACAAVVFADWGKRSGTSPTGWLIAFTAWVVAITLLGPMIFQGTQVIPSRQGIEQVSIVTQPLNYTISNFAQLIYLGLGVAAVHYLMRSKSTTVAIAAWGLGTAVVLSFLKYVAVRGGLPWPDGFFDNSPNFRYIETTATGEARFRGIFSEPSGLANFAAVAIVFFTVRAIQQRGRARFLSIGIAAAGVVNLLVSTATSALVAPAAIVVIASGWALWRFVFRGAKLNPHVAALMTFGLALIILLGRHGMALAVSMISDKLDTVSFYSRTNADRYSLGLLDDSMGLGLGLGSNRPSSLIPMLVSDVGIVGMILFALALGAIVRRSWPHREARPAAWALVALVLTKCIVGPDLSTPPVFWLLLGVLANYGLRQPDIGDGDVSHGDRLDGVARPESDEATAPARGNGDRVSCPAW